MMWVGVEDSRSFGVVKWHFENGPKHSLRLWIGETVRIRGETKDWFLVTKTPETESGGLNEETGIVPKNHLHIQPSYVLPTGSGDSSQDNLIIPRQPPLVQEITDVLKEWHKVAKKLFLVGDMTRFGEIRCLILQLHVCRTSINCPDLTVEGRRELKKQVAEIIDTGNNLLNLDMSVRDTAGNTLNPALTSTVELYRQHLLSREKLDKKATTKSGVGSSVGSSIDGDSTMCIAVTCQRMTWRIVDECQVRFYLYDADQDVVFTEAGLLTLNTTANQNQTQIRSTRFLFTDLGSHDLERNRVYLIAYIVRVGAMEFREDKQSGSVVPFSTKNLNNNSGLSVRRPWGVAAREITQLMRHKGGETELSTTMPFIPFGEFDCLKSAVIKCIEGGKEINAIDKGLFQCLVNLVYTVKPDLAGGAAVNELVNGNVGDLLIMNGLSSFGAGGIEGIGTSVTRDVVVRKMGFPEVILPNDVRNEFYVRLSFGEFHRSSKSAERNVQVTMSCHNNRGELIKGILYSGNDTNKVSLDTYQSVVYYHDDKPKWHEFVKVCLPMVIEEFSSTHLKFTFKHRSSSESKDKQEKPFALAYLKLKTDKGTAVPDEEHKLRVYKVDGKQYREFDVSYLNLPSFVPTSSSQQSQQLKSHAPGLTWSQKDSFSIRTILCSTKFTQNEHLLELLQWSSKSQAASNQTTETNESRIKLGEILLRNLQKILKNIVRVSGEEIVKFLPDIFDALFYVLVKPVESILSDLNVEWDQSVLNQFIDIKDQCDTQIFECLIYIFEVVLNPKFQKFKSVLSHYIEDGFTATLAYKQLIKELDNSFKRPAADKILKIMKSFEWFFKFIIRSFSIRLQLEHMNVEVIEMEGEVEAETEFEHLIVNLFSSINNFVAISNREYILTAQGSVLKYLPSVIEPLALVIEPMKLSELLVDLLRWVHPGQLVNAKLGTIGEIVKSSLFRHPNCRTTLQPIITMAIREHLPGNDNEMKRRLNETTKIRSKNKTTQILGKEVQGPVKIISETPSHSTETVKSVELLNDMMNILYRNDIGPVSDNITFIMHVLLQPLIQSIATIGNKDPLAGNMVAILLGLFRQMTKKHYQKLILNIRSKPNVNGEFEMISFTNELLITLKSIITSSYFPSTWAEMILLQNSIILNVLKQFSTILKVEYSGSTDESNFEQLIWTNFFSCAVSFTCSDSLSLDKYSRVKRHNIVSCYGDMRREASELIYSMWFSLGQSKRKRFVPSMVGLWLELAFVREPQIQASVMSILFDMLRCEFDEPDVEEEIDELGIEESDEKMRKEVVKDIVHMEDELVKRLVEFIESGKGDPGFATIFKDSMYECCLHDNSGLQQLGLRMVDMLTKLIDLLLEFRQVIIENEIGNIMNCLVNLLDFSMEIGRKELYLRYLYKLLNLHAKSGNYTEAAFTLKLHSRQLDWSEEECPAHLRSPLHPQPLHQTQWEVKEALYYEIINYFDKAKMWECALEVCDELRSQYAEETYNYALLSLLLHKMASFYNNILKGVRCDPEYFKVAFFGTSFPPFLQDKAFVYRGKEYEKLTEFEVRMLERFPKAELLRSLNRPSEEIRSGAKQYLQICTVYPVMNTGNGKRMSGMKYADESIRKYYKTNNVNKFIFSRPYHREPKDPKNEFASLWIDRYTLWTSNSFPGIMSWFPIIKETSQQVKPIVKAIESMEEVNENLREMVLTYVLNPNEDLGGLTMKLTGILDAAVMGGVANYESAFLTESYLEREEGDATLVDRLKTLICHQVPIIYQCLLIHEKKAPDSLAPLQAHLQERYNNLIEHMKSFYGVSLHCVQDESLTRDIERAMKRKVAQSTRHHPSIEDASTISDSTIQSRHNYASSPSMSGILARGKGSFSSTMSLYSSGFGSKMSTTKSMGSISKQRRSTQGCLEENFQPLQQHAGHKNSITSLSPANPSLGSISKLFSSDSTNDLNKTRDSSLFSPQANKSSSSLKIDNRRSFTWTSQNNSNNDGGGGSDRNSTHSLTISQQSSATFQSLQTQSTNSSNSISSLDSSNITTTGTPGTTSPKEDDEQEQELVPPPLPPKAQQQNHVESNDAVPPKPPPKPPMKPPLSH